MAKISNLPLLSAGITKRTFMSSVANLVISLLSAYSLMKGDTGTTVNSYSDKAALAASDVTRGEATLLSTGVTYFTVTTDESANQSAILSTSTPGICWVPKVQRYRSVADMLASKETGDKDQLWYADGFQYMQAASEAVDHHLTTSGGTKLYVMPDLLNKGAYHLDAWGCPKFATIAANSTTTYPASCETQFAQAEAAAKAAKTGVIIGPGTYLYTSTKSLTWDGGFIQGAGNLNTCLFYSGSGEALVTGDKKVAVDNISHAKWLHFQIRLHPDADCTVVLFNSASSFQTVIDGFRYSASQTAPKVAVTFEDSDGGASYSVRTIFNDVYIEGAPTYGGSTAAAACPVGIWLMSAIQTVMGNVHVQDCECNIRLGSDGIDFVSRNVQDITISGNSRVQHGDRGLLVGTGSGIEIYDAGGINLSGSTIYTNNNAPNPGLATQYPISIFGVVVGLKITDLATNMNDRSDAFLRIGKSAVVSGSAINGLSLLGPKPVGQILIEPGASINGLSFGPVYMDNPNAFMRRQILAGTKAHILDLTAMEVGNLLIDASSETIAGFSGGVLGNKYLMKVDMINGGALSLDCSSNSIYANTKSIISIADDSILTVTPARSGNATIYKIEIDR